MCRANGSWLGLAWLDTGTPEGLLKAAEYVEAVQTRQGYYIACIEEIAYRRGFIEAVNLRELGKSMCKTDYGRYLIAIAEELEEEYYRWRATQALRAGQ